MKPGLELISVTTEPQDQPRFARADRGDAAERIAAGQNAEDCAMARAMADQPSPGCIEIDRVVDPADPLPDRPELAQGRQFGPAAEGQQPHGVEQHQQRAGLVQDRRSHRAEDAERRQDHRHGIEAKGKPDDVLLNHRDRGARQLHQSGQIAERVAQDDEVARLGRKVRADSRQRDSRVGLRQGRGVVDAVADHRHFPARLLLLLDPRRLAGRHELGENRLDVHLPGHAPGDRLAIAREQGDLPHLQMLQVVDHVVRLGPDRVAQPDQARDLAIDRNHKRGLGQLIDRVHRGRTGVADRDLVLFQQPAVADEDADRSLAGSCDEALHTCSGEHADLGGPYQVEPALSRLVGHRARQRVSAGLLDRGRQPEEHVLIAPPSAARLANRGLPAVRVPVLSKAKVSQAASRSSA